MTTSILSGIVAGFATAILLFTFVYNTAAAGATSMQIAIVNVLFNRLTSFFSVSQLLFFSFIILTLVVITVGYLIYVATRTASVARAN